MHRSFGIRIIDTFVRSVLGHVRREWDNLALRPAQVVLMVLGALIFVLAFQLVLIPAIIDLNNWLMGWVYWVFRRETAVELLKFTVSTGGWIKGVCKDAGIPLNFADYQVGLMFWGAILAILLLRPVHHHYNINIHR